MIEKENLKSILNNKNDIINNQNNQIILNGYNPQSF
jgi:hypothetical protein